MRHVQLDGVLRRRALLGLCGATISLEHTATGHECETCDARSAARMLGARFVACESCMGSGMRAHLDSPSVTCAGCGGRGVFQVVDPL